MSVSELSDDDTSLELPADGESQTKEGKKVTQGGLWNGVFCNESDSDTNEKSKSDSNTAPHDSIILLNAIEERKWRSVSNSNFLSFRAYSFVFNLLKILCHPGKKIVKIPAKL